MSPEEEKSLREDLHVAEAQLKLFQDVRTRARAVFAALNGMRETFETSPSPLLFWLDGFFRKPPVNAFLTRHPLVWLVIGGPRLALLRKLFVEELKHEYAFVISQVKRLEKEIEELQRKLKLHEAASPEDPKEDPKPTP